MQWNYVQFCIIVLLSTLNLLDPLSFQEGSNPVTTLLHLFAVVNATDDDKSALVEN